MIGFNTEPGEYCPDKNLLINGFRSFFNSSLNSGWVIPKANLFVSNEGVETHAKTRFSTSTAVKTKVESIDPHILITMRDLYGVDDIPYKFQSLCGGGGGGGAGGAFRFQGGINYHTTGGAGGGGGASGGQILISARTITSNSNSNNITANGGSGGAGGSGVIIIRYLVA